MRPYVLPLVARGGRLAPAPGGGSLEAVVDAQGAAVEAAPGAPPVAAFAHGALVEGMPPCDCEFDVCWAHGAAVPVELFIPTPAPDEAGCCCTCTLGPLGVAASGSRSHLKNLPKGKCCTTGNFPSTSASYIFSMPLLILPHPSLMPEMLNRMGECSQNGPFLTSKMNWMALKYMLLDLFCARMGLEVIVSGSGAESKDPCSGVGDVGDVMGGPS
jgi:hypothetical protein